MAPLSTGKLTIIYEWKKIFHSQEASISCDEMKMIQSCAISGSLVGWYLHRNAHGCHLVSLETGIKTCFRFSVEVSSVRPRRRNINHVSIDVDLCILVLWRALTKDARVQSRGSKECTNYARVHDA